MLRCHRVQQAPGPVLRVLAERRGQLESRGGQSPSQDLVAALDHADRTVVVPERVVRSRQEPAHDLQPAAAAGRAERVGHLVPERQLEELRPHRGEVHLGRGVRAGPQVPAAQELLTIGVERGRQRDLQQRRDEHLGVRVEVVHLHRTGLRDRDLRAGGDARSQQGANPLRAVPVVPVGGQERTSSRRGHRLVRRDDDAVRRVQLGGHVGRGDEPLPVVRAVPAGARPRPVGRHDTGDVSPDRDPPRRLVADVTGRRREHDVLGRDVEQRRGSLHVGRVGGGVEGEDRVRGPTRGQRRPSERHGVAPERRVLRHRGGGHRGEWQHVRDDRTVHRRTDRQVDVRTAVDLDGLGALVERHLGAVTQIGGGADPLEEEVRHVGAEVRQAPGEQAVVPDDHAGQPREREPADVERAGRRHVAALQRHLGPDPRRGDRQVRVVRQDRGPGRGVGTGDDPRVRADPVAPPDQVRHGGECPGRRGDRRLEVGGGEVRPRRRRVRRGGRAHGVRGDDRLVAVVRVRREELVHPRDVADRAERGRARELLVVVAAQVPGHRLEPCERVHG